MPNIKRHLKENEQDFLNKIGKVIRENRIKLGLTQYNLAGKANIAENIVGQIERGEVSVSLVTLYRICNALELSVKVINSNS